MLFFFRNAQNFEDKFFLFTYDLTMKILVIVLMLLDFAGVAFGRGTLPEGLYFSLMPIMLLLIVAYWYVMFWFSKKKLLKIMGKEPDFEIFAGKVPKDPTLDLQRGRLVISDNRLVLYQKILKEKVCKEVWSMPVSEIKSVGFGTLLPLRRKGIRIYTEEDTVEFTAEPVMKRKDEFYKALGWEIPQNTEIQTGK